MTTATATLWETDRAAPTDLARIEPETLAPVRPTTSPVACYLAGLTSPRSRRTMLGSLHCIARMVSDGRHDAHGFPWHDLRHAHTAAIRSALAERYAPATANRILAGLRGVLRACWRLELIDADTYHRAADVQAVRGSTLPAGRSLAAGEVRALFDSCARDQTAAGRRDAALLAVLYGCGLRRSEVVGLDLDDYSPDTGELVVNGKGNKQRTAHLVNGSAAAMGAWLQIRGTDSGPIFHPIDKGGSIDRTRGITDQSVYGMLRKRGREARVADFSPHDLRRSFVGDLLDAGADLAMVQALAGHASPTTTSRYDRRPEARKREAAELLHVPYEPAAA